MLREVIPDGHVRPDHRTIVDADSEQRRSGARERRTGARRNRQIVERVTATHTRGGRKPSETLCAAETCQERAHAQCAQRRTDGPERIVEVSAVPIERERRPPPGVEGMPAIDECGSL